RPERGPSGRRLYDEDDLAIIRRMPALVDSGVSAHDAAQAARSSSQSPPPVEHEEEDPLVHTLATAAARFDEAIFIATVRSGVEAYGWSDGMDRVIFPGLKRIGLYWETAVFPPANEHFASQLVGFEIAAAIQALETIEGDAPAIVMACPQDER